MVIDQACDFDEDNLTEDDIECLAPTEQVTVFGFACDQTPVLLPMPIWLAHRLARRLSEVRLDETLPYLAPDGTTQVGVEYKDFKPHRIHSLTINASQKDRSYPKLNVLRDDIRATVIEPVFADEDMPVKPDDKTSVFVNLGGPLKMGGPTVHSGMTGRKNASDTYGGYSRTGGSALSGKDPLRIDRVGAYAARYAAKNIVAAGLASECEIQLSYSIGVPQPVSIQIETRGTASISEDALNDLLLEHFDFRLGPIVKQFDLRRLPALSKRGFYRKLASFGHFGRRDINPPWEATDKAELLKEAASR
jgi:S-adenosylmethionine synthetase